MRLLIRRKKRLNKLPYLRSERKSFNRYSKKKNHSFLKASQTKLDSNPF